MPKKTAKKKSAARKTPTTKKTAKKKTTATKKLRSGGTAEKKTAKKVSAPKEATDEKKVDKNGWTEILHYRLRHDAKQKRYYFEVVTKAGHMLMTSKPYVHAVQARRGGVAIIENLKRNAPAITPDSDSIPDYVDRVVGVVRGPKKSKK